MITPNKLQASLSSSTTLFGNLSAILLAKILPEIKASIPSTKVSCIIILTITKFEMPISFSMLISFIFSSVMV